MTLDPAAYGEAIADVYDDWYAEVSDVDGTVATVMALADGTPVLELGIGTGRIALPLRAAGVEVHGVDASPAMVDQLRAKPGGADVPVLVADFSEQLPQVEGGYGVVLAAFNTLLNVTGPGALDRCLALVAEALRPGGTLVVEAVVPGDDAASSGVDVRHVDESSVVLSVFRTDGEVVTGSLVSIDAGGVRLRPWSIRTVGPETLDAMAATAGLVLERRTADWHDAPYGEESVRYVAIYRRPGPSIGKR